MYVNHYIEPAFFGSNEVQTEITRLSTRFGERAREYHPPRGSSRVPNAVIAVWGALQLEQLDPSDVAVVASGGSPHRGLLVSFLGDLARSAKAGVPVYRIAGGAGFLWVATFSQDGRGVLRFLAADASQIASAVLSTPPPSPHPAPGEPAPISTIPKALPQDDPFVTDCDAYSASDSDAERKGEGIPFDKINPAKAIPACLDALSDYPNSLRFQYQLGRAYERNGDFDKAMTWYRKAADRGYAEAQTSLKKLETSN